MNYPFTRHPQPAVYDAALRPRLPRLVILMAAMLMLSALSLATSAKQAEASAPQKPTIALVHGAWADPSG